MRVEPAQLVPGCVLLGDVKGKSNRAIMLKKTVLSEEHIIILDKFLISNVDVGSKLANGETFTPRVTHRKKESKQQDEAIKDVRNLPFKEHYQYVVKSYKRLFIVWQNSMQVDMPTVRKLVIPLFQRIELGDADIFTLYQYNTKKDYMYHHSVAVGLIAAYLGKKMGYSNADYTQIGLAGFLSDCGMAKISPTILNKTKELSALEIDEMKKHPTYSYRMVEQIPTLTQIVKLAILQHHERMDGSGYPLGVQKDQIYAYSRIVAVSDMYHAMTCERLYQSKQSPFQVIEKLMRDRYTHFDHKVVETFGKSLATYSIGMKVRLSNGNTGEIVFVEDKYPTRPMVQVDQLDDILTLKNNTAIYIDEIMET